VAKVRVYELAKELNVESKAVMAKLQEFGEFVRSASSTIEAPVVRKLRESFPAGEAPAASAGVERRDLRDQHVDVRVDGSQAHQDRRVGVQDCRGRDVVPDVVGAEVHEHGVGGVPVAVAVPSVAFTGPESTSANVSFFSYSVSPITGTVNAVSPTCQPDDRWNGA